MPAQWPKNRRLIGKKHTRIDGAQKSTGRAKYSYDINRPGMLHAVMVRSPHAHATVVKIDTAAAEKMPGVRAVVAVIEAGKEVYYAGDEIAAVAADTEEQARDAAHALAAAVEYKALPFLVDEENARQSNQRTVLGKGANNLGKPQTFTKGNVEAAYKEADGVAEGTYGANTICHQCLEPHGLVAEWDADGGLTVWASTQAVYGTAKQLAEKFNVPLTKVKCITHHMGGGYGSKFGAGRAGLRGGGIGEKGRQAGQAHARPRVGSDRGRQPALGVRQGEDRRQEGRLNHGV